MNEIEQLRADDSTPRSAESLAASRFLEDIARDRRIQRGSGYDCPINQDGHMECTPIPGFDFPNPAETNNGLEPAE